MDPGLLAWVKGAVHFEHAAQAATLLDYVHEVDHVAERLDRLERAIAAAVQAAPERMRAVIAALQALRGIAQISAVTIVAEVGELSRFTKARQVMAYSGTVPSEHSSGSADPTAEESRRPAMPTSGASSSKPRGPIATDPRSVRRSANGTPRSTRM